VEAYDHPMLRNAKELEHYELRARDGMVGRVSDFFFDEQQWRVRYLAVETGGWLDRRKVLIAPEAVSRAEWDQRLLPVDLSMDQVRNSPTIDLEQAFSRHHESALRQYYNWPVYWGVAGFPEMGLPPPVEPAEAAQAAAPAETEGTAALREQHLHRIGAVRGDTVEAADGRVGHVEDFLIDDRSWEIRYLVVDTRNWWPGKIVAIAAQWVREVGRGEAKVHVDLTCTAIKDSPAYDPMKPMPPDYAGQLNAQNCGPALDRP
jgi:sporulation protein YlmC with PRC-barrel domain